MWIFFSANCRFRCISKEIQNPTHIWHINKFRASREICAYNRALCFGCLGVHTGQIFLVSFWSFPDPLFFVSRGVEFSSRIKSGTLFWRPSLCQMVRRREFLNKKVFRYHWILCGRTSDRQTSGPCFGALRHSILLQTRNFRVPELTCYHYGRDPVSEQEFWQFANHFGFGTLSKFPHNQHPAGHRLGVRAGVRKLQNTCGTQIL